ncbi:hypothetical protein Tco_1045505 [Tanacetum coccineum]|uniref:Reverse transcriptase domain-containing protein n=1 Tax=Tanacetum coccineum TaxID=301880 RepID=A0ABQ5GUJ3_9ASTR
MESTFRISECAERRKVKFDTATLHGRALTWWNSQVATLGLEVANGKPWTELRDTNIAAYTERFNELALLCPDAFPNENKKVELYIKGLLEIIKGETTSSRPAMLNDVVRIAHTLIEQKIQAKNEKNAEGNKRRWENNNQGIVRRSAPSAIRWTIRQRIVDMDWLVKHDALIVCGKKEVHIPVKGKMLVVKGNCDISRLKVVSYIKARIYIERGCHLFVAHVTKKDLKEKHLEDVTIICDFPKVFPDDLPRLPPPRQVEFGIELMPGAVAVARAPYRLAPSEMKELSDQLKELSEKGFI